MDPMQPMQVPGAAPIDAYGDLANLLGQGGFDSTGIEPAQDYEVLPPGQYPILIEKACVKQTKSGNGHYIEVTEVVVDGPCKNRKLWR